MLIFSILNFIEVAHLNQLLPFSWLSSEPRLRARPLSSSFFLALHQQPGQQVCYQSGQQVDYQTGHQVSYQSGQQVG